MAAPPHDRSRRLAVVGLGVVSMFFAATRMFGGGGEDPFASLGQEPIAQPALEAATTGTTAPVTGPEPHNHETAAATAVRDPFCPLTPPAGIPAAPCPTAPAAPAPPAEDTPPVLLDVFADGGHDHARLRIGTTLVTAHLGETTGGYRLIALTERCAELIRNGEQRTVCADEAHGPDAAPAR